MELVEQIESGRGIAPQDTIRDAVERGEEHIARELHGDAAVDATIRTDLEADGWNADAVFAGANGYEDPAWDDGHGNPALDAAPAQTVVIEDATWKNYGGEWCVRVLASAGASGLTGREVDVRKRNGSTRTVRLGEQVATVSESVALYMPERDRRDEPTEANSPAGWAASTDDTATYVWVLSKADGTLVNIFESKAAVTSAAERAGLNGWRSERKRVYTHRDAVTGVRKEED